MRNPRQREWKRALSVGAVVVVVVGGGVCVVLIRGLHAANRVGSCAFRRRVALARRGAAGAGVGFSHTNTRVAAHAPADTDGRGKRASCAMAKAPWQTEGRMPRRMSLRMPRLFFAGTDLFFAK